MGPFPPIDSIPLDALQVVYSEVTGGHPDRHTLVQAIVTIVLYADAKIPVGQSAPAFATAHFCTSHAEAAGVMQAAFSTNGFDLGTIIKLLPLLLQILQSLGGLSGIFGHPAPVVAPVSQPSLPGTPLEHALPQSSKGFPGNQG